MENSNEGHTTYGRVVKIKYLEAEPEYFILEEQKVLNEVLPLVFLLIALGLMAIGVLEIAGVTHLT